MKKKRFHGEGSIYQRKDGRWVGQFQIGVSPEGKPNRVYVYGVTRSEVAKKFNKIKSDYHRGKLFKTKMVTVGEWLDTWINIYQEDVSINFRARRKDLINLHIKPALGEKPLNKLVPSDIRLLYKKLSTEGRIDGKGGLASGTIKHIHNILKPALDRAVEDGKIPHSIMLGMKAPKITRKREPRALTAYEIQRYMAVLEVHRMYAAYVVELTSGLRRGELSGLHWNDLNWESGEVSIKRQLSRIRHDHGSTLEYDTLKTNSSYRSILLPPITLKVLTEHFNRQAEEKLLASDSYNDEDLIFCTPLGKKIDSKYLYYVHCKVLKKANIEHVAFHDLRHTVITLLMEKKEPLPSVQALSGHADPKMLLKYSHVTENMKHSTMQALESLMEGIVKLNPMASD